jgi:hypothetical protein
LPVFIALWRREVALKLNMSWHHPDLYFSAAFYRSRGVPGQLVMEKGNAEQRTRSSTRMINDGMMYGLAALAVGVSSIRLLFILWRVVKAHLPVRDLVCLGLLGLIVVIQGASELFGPGITALIYILAGVR